MWTVLTLERQFEQGWDKVASGLAFRVRSEEGWDSACAHTQPCQAAVRQASRCDGWYTVTSISVIGRGDEVMGDGKEVDWSSVANMPMTDPIRNLFVIKVCT